MAFKNLVFLVALAVFLQSAVADPVVIERWEAEPTHAPEENEILKDNGQEMAETKPTNAPEENEILKDNGQEMAETKPTNAPEENEVLKDNGQEMVETKPTNAPEENEILKDNGQEMVETNNVTEFSVDPETTQVEIPRYTGIEQITVMHDYEYNLTTIIDVDHQRCFLMDLDYNRYSRSSVIFANLFNERIFDLEEVRQKKKVLLPQLDDTEELGPNIGLKCRGFHTYLLVDKLDHNK